MSKEFLKETYGFVLGFVTVIISLSSFKDELKNIIIDIGFMKFSISNYLLIVILTFTVSLYLYALDYNLAKTKLSKLKVVRIILPTAYVIFVLGIISPVMILAILGVYKVSLFASYFIKSLNSISISIIFSGISILVAILSSVSYSSSKLNEEKYKSYISDMVTGFSKLNLIRELIDENKYLQSIYESIAFIKAQLTLITGLKDIDFYNRKDDTLFRLLVEDNKIDQDLYNKISPYLTTEYLDSLKNYLDKPNNIRQQAEELFEIVTEVLSKTLRNTDR